MKHERTRAYYDLGANLAGFLSRLTTRLISTNSPTDYRVPTACHRIAEFIRQKRIGYKLTRDISRHNARQTKDYYANCSLFLRQATTAVNAASAATSCCLEFTVILTIITYIKACSRLAKRSQSRSRVFQNLVRASRQRLRALATLPSARSKRGWLYIFAFIARANFRGRFALWWNTSAFCIFVIS